MTTQEYDRIRLEALPVAIEIIENLRTKQTKNPPAWAKLQHAGTRLGEQLSREFKAYFEPEATTAA